MPDMPTPGEVFEKLLERNESDTLDFKQQLYSFEGDTPIEKRRKRGDFVKDIICMANTPRDDSAYIVFGVRASADGKKELRSLGEHVDDADLQAKFEAFCHPHPRFRYEPVTYEGKSYAYIEIPADRNIGPCVPIVDKFDSLRQFGIYHRRNSKNALADATEQKKIYEWFRDSRELGVPHETDDPVWDQFLRAVHDFDPSRRYLLCLSPGTAGSDGPIEGFANVPWFFVADFDPDSATLGFLRAVKTPLGDRLSLHRITRDTQIAINPSGATYWYFARGMAGRTTTLSLGTWLDWQRAYAADVKDRVAKLAAAIDAPVSVVVLWTDTSLTRHLDSFLGTLVSSLGDSVEITFVTDATDTCAELAAQYQAQHMVFPLPQFFHGMASLSKAGAADLNNVVLPSSSGVDVALDEQTVAWIEEEVELVHRNAGMHPAEGASFHSAFLRGKEISWFELGLHVDVDREIADKVKKAIRHDLDKRLATRINLYHAPGAGATTLARRLLWDFRNEFPALVVKRTQPNETVERVQKVFAATGQPVLIKVDGSTLSDRKSDDLHAALSASNTPFVMLQVLRRFDKPRTAERAFYLPQELTPAECSLFAVSLAREMPAKESAIEAAARSPDAKQRSPFYLGLVAFERDFTSLGRYISAHIEGLNERQNRMLVYLALSHYYGQQTIPQQSFADILGTPHNRSVDLSRVFPESALSLLVTTEKDQWRTVHHLVAEEILHQALSGYSEDTRTWRNSLADWAVEFADFCVRRLPEPSERSLELVRRVFIYRDESELLGTEASAARAYSQIITDIPVTQGKERVLQHLTKLFPDEAHFWAHLARFHANELKDFDGAIEMADRALALQPDDHVLHHMKGMVCRRQVYGCIDEGKPLDETLLKAKQASEAFTLARQHGPDDEHGFISEAQLVIKFLDYVGKVANTDAVSAAAQHHDPWVKEGFQAVEDLLMQVRQKRRWAADSDFEQRCQASLDLLYGKHEKALQIWDNLLTRKGQVYAPPIRRQIVWTLLARRQRDWSALRPNEVERSVALLEANIKDDPNDDRNIRLWIQAIRHQENPPTLESVIERVAYWASNTDSLEAYYYLYVLHALLVINGSAVAADQAVRTMQRCKEKSRYRRDKNWSYEWFGKEQGLKQLVHRDRLGDWDRSTRFWRQTESLARIQGVISNISGPQAGSIEISHGLVAFFVPGISGHSAGRSENLPVTFFLGFSYDGLRAWSVKDA